MALISATLPFSFLLVSLFQFVAHPHCQQRLTQLWYEGLPRWYNANWISSWIFTFLAAVLYPIVSIMYIIYPWGKVGQYMRIPHVQFVCHTASCIIFLLLLGLQSQDDMTEIKTSDSESDSDIADQRGEEPSITEWMVVAWVLGKLLQRLRSPCTAYFIHLNRVRWHRRFYLVVVIV